MEKVEKDLLGKQRLRLKWGDAISGGFTGFIAVPDVLIRSQSKLRLDNGDLVTLLNILMHWWSADRMPYPRAEVIARRMGVSRRTVERHFARLEELGLAERLPVGKGDCAAPGARCFDLSKLVAELERQATVMRDHEEYKEYVNEVFERSQP